jgi:hypothetical protein
MKYNLKTKPSYRIGTFEFKKEAMEWFEGLDKELRDRIEMLESLPSLSICETQERATLKEFLGEV